MYKNFTMSNLSERDTNIKFNVLKRDRKPKISDLKKKLKKNILKEILCKFTFKIHFQLQYH